GDGIFIFGSDLSDTFAQGAVPRTNGISFSADTSNSPFRLKVGHEDGLLYVTDQSTTTGNLYVMDPDVNNVMTNYVLKAISSPSVAPVGLNNNHGRIQAVEITGSLATSDLKVYTMDGDYQTDPTSA